MASEINILISVIAPVYQAENFLVEFCDRIIATLKAITPSYELILVNDGSIDNTLSIITDLHKKDSSIKLINLSRNFGQFAATRVGLSHAQGEFIYVTDCDIEESPEWLADYYHKIIATNADVVFGAQKNVSPQTLLERAGGRLMRFIIKHFSDIHMVKNCVTARLMRRHYVNALLQFTERCGGFYILCQLTGFSQECVTVQKSYKGYSSYSLSKKVTMFIDHIVSITTIMLTCIIWAAGLMLLIAMLLLLKWFFTADTGFLGVITSIWLVGGFIMTGIAIVGMYISRVLIEVKQRPIAIVKNTLGFIDEHSIL